MLLQLWNMFNVAPDAHLAIAPLLIAAILAAAGAVKGMTVDKGNEDRERALAAETQRYSPWTGLKAGEIHRADPLGNAVQGGLSGMAQGQNMQDSEAKNANLNMWTQLGKTNPQYVQYLQTLSKSQGTSDPNSVYMGS